MKSKVLVIEGMGCSGCVDAVDGALRSVKGVSAVKVDLNKGLAEVGYNEDVTQKADLENAVEEAGYHVSGTR